MLMIGGDGSVLIQYRYLWVVKNALLTEATTGDLSMLSGGFSHFVAITQLAIAGMKDEKQMNLKLYQNSVGLRMIREEQSPP
jgi:hypothetical protein